MKSADIVIGRIVGVHGVKGFFKILIYSETESNFFMYKDHFKIDNRTIDIEKSFRKKNVLICKSNMISSKEEALKLVGKNILINEKYIKKVDEGEYLHKDLVGCKVMNNKQKNIGKVKAVHNFGAGDVLELDSNFPYMIRLNDIKKDNIDIKAKKINIEKQEEK